MAEEDTAEHDEKNQAGQSDQTAEDFEPLTVTYEHLRHCEDPDELSRFARTPLPDRSDQAAFSRVTALLEAVAGNPHTPVADRVFLGETMPFPNILVKLSSDPDVEVRKAVAGNTADKNWLVGNLTKDPEPEVRDAALVNPRTSWKMRLEGAQNPDVDAQTLDFLGKLGVELEPNAPVVLASMVRRAVAANPNCSPETKARLADDPQAEVARQARK